MEKFLTYLGKDWNGGESLFKICDTSWKIDRLRKQRQAEIRRIETHTVGSQKRRVDAAGVVNDAKLNVEQLETDMARLRRDRRTLLRETAGLLNR